MKKIYLLLLSILTLITAHSIYSGAVGKWFEGAANTVAKEVSGAATTVYDKALKPTGEAFETAAKTVADTATQAGNWIAERFKDTQTTRGIDYGIRKAGLASARAIATASLESAKAIASGSLDAAEATARLAVKGAEEFLDKVVRNVSLGTLKGPAEAAKGILIGVEKSTVLTLEGARQTTKAASAVLLPIDINKIYYKGSLQDLQSGVLGNVEIAMTLFDKYDFSQSISIDPKAGAENLYAALKPVVNSIIEKMDQVILSPLKDAVHSIDTALKPTRTVQAQVAQTAMTPPAALQAQVDAANKAAQIAEQKAAEIKTIQSDATATIKATVAKADTAAEQALEQKKQQTTTP